MNNQFPTQYHVRRRSHPLQWDILAARILSTLLAGGLLYIAILLMGTLAYSLVYIGKIFPGVAVEGVSLGGLRPAEASAKLASAISYPEMGQITFQNGGQTWIALPKDLGMYPDVETSALQAYRYGRENGLFLRPILQFKALVFGESMPLHFIFDEQTTIRYMDSIAAVVNQPMQEASLTINGTDVVATPGKIGYTLDIVATTGSLLSELQNLNNATLPLVIEESVPAIMDATAQAEEARKILSTPLTLQLPKEQGEDSVPWVMSREQVAQMLTIVKAETTDGAEYQVGLKTSSIQNYLENIAPSVYRQAENARFIFNDDTQQLEVIEPAVTGRTLDIAASIHQINEKMAHGEHTVDLVVTSTDPQITDDITGEDFGITELVSRYTSYFYGSSAERIQNIQTAASRFHGVLVPPQTTFSMADVLGDVSLDNGYAEALIIFGDQTIKGVGGGVCQVSTTLFRTAFFGGFPILERYPHAYRVSYYEYSASGGVDETLAGLDATVFVPVVDFKFTNDTPYWLLMETYINTAARTLTWKFYSTSDGRSVEWETSGLQNIVEPGEPIYRENEELAKNEVNQVEWEVAGADVTVSRTVYRNGEIYFEDSFYTHYIPWQSVYEYGPGTNLKKFIKDNVPMPY